MNDSHLTVEEKEISWFATLTRLGRIVGWKVSGCISYLDKRRISWRSHYFTTLIISGENSVEFPPISEGKSRFAEANSSTFSTRCSGRSIIIVGSSNLYNCAGKGEKYACRWEYYRYTTFEMTFLASDTGEKSILLIQAFHCAHESRASGLFFACSSRFNGRPAGYVKSRIPDSFFRNSWKQSMNLPRSLTMEIVDRWKVRKKRTKFASRVARSSWSLTNVIGDRSVNVINISDDEDTKRTNTVEESLRKKLNILECWRTSQ